MNKLAALAAVVLATTGLTAASTSAGAAPARVLSTYACDSAYGEAATDVAVRVKLPAQVKQGASVPARTIRFGLVVPEALVDQLRAFGVRSLSGDATGARVRVGGLTVPVRGLDLPTTPVPSSGAMTLQGTGRMAAFTVRKTGSYTVRVPAAFDADVVVARRSSGSFTLALDCGVQAGSPTRLGAVRVVR